MHIFDCTSYAFIPIIVVIVVIVVMLLIVAIIKIKFKFWALQPVFHAYDFWYMLFPPGIVSQDLPTENKYCNFKNIQTITYDKLSKIQITKFINFINLHYLRNNENVFSPKLHNVAPYFSNHNNTSIFSFYKELVNRVDIKTGNIIEDEKIIGVMTTRPIKIRINDAVDKKTSFVAYYVDYLCVDKTFRKKGIAPQVIQTHHYAQRRINEKVQVSLFKREGVLTGIVPLCAYSTFGFSSHKWSKPANLDGRFKLLEITPLNFHILLDFIDLNTHNFDIIITSDVSNLIELIKTNNIFIYAVLHDNQIKSAYFYRKTCVFFEKDSEILTCFASVNNFDNNEIFIQGFKCSFWLTAEKHCFGFAAIENISHNNLIINYLRIRNSPKLVSPTAYFFYNFAYHTFQPRRVLFIN